MVVVRYYENNKEVLNQLCSAAPKAGAELVVKGRKGKVLEVKDIATNDVRVDVELEVVRKAVVADLGKKKK